MAKIKLLKQAGTFPKDSELSIDQADFLITESEKTCTFVVVTNGTEKIKVDRKEYEPILLNDFKPEVRLT